MHFLLIASLQVGQCAFFADCRWGNVQFSLIANLQVGQCSFFADCQLAGGAMFIFC